MENENFIDYVKIWFHSGRGGDGSAHLARTAQTPKGGPDGGDGGRGGHIILRGNAQLWTLLHLKYTKHLTAEDGEAGGKNQRFGKNGRDVIVEVPLGTIVRNEETMEKEAEILEDKQEIIYMRGGRGGLGNTHFKSSVRQTPRFAQTGESGSEGWKILELQVLADVGLVGFPNAGKSTFISVVSNARPKIANYPFTTLSPNLGVVETDGGGFVMADIPGLIEGASEGIGLGHDFLRHVDRCRLLVHVLDAAGSEGRDPAADFDAVNAELSRYSPALAARPQIVAANKADLLQDPSALDPLRAKADALGFPLFLISAATHQGVRELLREILRVLPTLPPVRVYEPEYVPPAPETNAAPEIRRRDDGAWVVEGAWLERLMADINFADYESRMYFDRALRQAGLYERLEALGIEDGDTVSLYGFEFEYWR